ncbi:hypothetical protein TNIN_369741 [Trichonephila inaurata madagascariensis]|uniref:Uncharacterized protein n=1 Tax=Trichonephila inaurata madagascariensis TaxID=2747483 RepID=A0A8X7CHP4_9ARAC|nr:hypothetical protein TNIN_369741 [Trichonephila inaurata madagascariensis]
MGYGFPIPTNTATVPPMVVLALTQKIWAGRVSGVLPGVDEGWAIPYRGNTSLMNSVSGGNVITKAQGKKGTGSSPDVTISSSADLWLLGVCEKSPLYLN